MHQQLRQRLLVGARILLLALVTVVAAWLFFRYAIPHRFFDLKIYLSAMHWWRDGNHLYDYAQPDFLQGQLYFTYPPFTALVLLPFSFLPVSAAATIFTIVTIAGVVLTSRWLLQAVHLGWWSVAFAVPLVLLIEPMRETIMLGQINIWLTVLILMDILILGTRNSRWTGIGVGLATALKIFPGIFIVYFLVTRQWRAAIVSMATAAGATLLAAAIAPRDSWDFWTKALWDTARVGRTDYTGNQSLLGLLSRLVAPDEPNRLIWLVLALAAGAFGMWRAAKAYQAGNPVAAMAITGLTAGLISPITWPHHLYWFVPALVAVLAAALQRGPASWPGGAKRRLLSAEARRRGRALLLWLVFIGGYVLSVCGVVSLTNWGTEAVPTDTPWLFLARNAFVLLGLALVIVVPIDRMGRLVRSGGFALPLSYWSNATSSGRLQKTPFPR